MGDFSNSKRILWLERAYEIIQAHLLPEAPPKANITFGFPGQGHTRRTNKVVGECWQQFSRGSFISIHPILGDDTQKLLAVLVHEMIHAAYPQDGHKGDFAKVAKRLGLKGRPNAPYAGMELAEKLNAIIVEIGKFPKGSGDYLPDQKCQKTRLIKAECSCGRKIRLSKQEYEKGPIICGICGKKYENYELDTDAFKRAGNY